MLQTPISGWKISLLTSVILFLRRRQRQLQSHLVTGWPYVPNVRHSDFQLHSRFPLRGRKFRPTPDHRCGLSFLLRPGLCRLRVLQCDWYGPHASSLWNSMFQWQGRKVQPPWSARHWFGFLRRPEPFRRAKVWRCVHCAGRDKIPGRRSCPASRIVKFRATQGVPCVASRH